MKEFEIHICEKGHTNYNEVGEVFLNTCQICGSKTKKIDGVTLTAESKDELPKEPD